MLPIQPTLNEILVLAKQIMYNREQADNIELSCFIRSVYKQFVKLGEQLIIDTAAGVIAWRQRYGD